MPNIKWRQEDVDLLRREIRNFNRKIDRLMKTGAPEVKAALPPKLSMKTAKQSIQTRGDFNKQIKSIRRLTEKGSEKLIKTKTSVVAPEFELKELRARVQQINAQRRKELKELGPIDEDNKALMGRIERAQLRPKKAPGQISPSGYAEYKRSVLKQSAPEYIRKKDQLFIENYMKAYKDAFGAEKAKKMEEMIKKIDPHKIVHAALTEERLSIGYTYDPNEAESVSADIEDAILELIPNE